MEFEITKKTKKRAKKRRIKNEKKWILLTTFSCISFLISVIAFAVGFFVIGYERLYLFGICGASSLCNTVYRRR